MAVSKSPVQQLALKAALAYYGFSSNTKAFPKGTKMNLVTPAACRHPDFTVVAEKVKSLWQENIGSLSRAARLSRDDLRAITKELGKTIPDDKLDDILVGIAATDPTKLLVVEVQHGEDSKLLLVNTAVHA